MHGRTIDLSKVHCFVSGVAATQLKRSSIDAAAVLFQRLGRRLHHHRARWQLAYHDKSINHDFFRVWYERIYGNDHAWR